MASSRASSSSEWCPPEQVSSGEWHPWPHRFELSISQNFGRTVIGSASCLQCRDLGNWPPPLPDLLSSLSLVISSFLSDDRRSQETQEISVSTVFREVDDVWSWFLVAFEAHPCFRF
uniref:Uncharacterized protein n=1 Tax=Cannabis sativa TaxID=3483 RepID=A0A803QZ03_CANSA